MSLRIYLVGLPAGLRPVEPAGAVRTRCHAVPAADAPVIVDDNYPIRLLPGGLGGTGPHAGRVLALLALNRHVEVVLFRDVLGIVVFFRLLEVDPLLAFLEAQHADPVYLRVLRLVVLFDAGIHASSATDAAGQIQAVAEEHPGKRFLVGHRDFLLVLLLVFLLEPREDLFDLPIVHLVKMLLKERIPKRRISLVQRERRARQAEGGPFQERSPVEMDTFSVLPDIFHSMPLQHLRSIQNT